MRGSSGSGVPRPRSEGEFQLLELVSSNARVGFVIRVHFEVGTPPDFLSQ